MTEIFDLIGALLVLVGALLCFGAAIALVRFPDSLSKMHAITKPQVLGLLCIVAGIEFTLRSWWTLGIMILIVFLQLITSPISANLISRAAYRSGLISDQNLQIDHLAEDLNKAGFEQRGSWQRAEVLEASAQAEDSTKPRPLRPHSTKRQA